MPILVLLRLAGTKQTFFFLHFTSIFFSIYLSIYLLLLILCLIV